MTLARRATSRAEIAESRRASSASRRCNGPSVSTATTTGALTTAGRKRASESRRLLWPRFSDGLYRPSHRGRASRQRNEDRIDATPGSELLAFALDVRE